MSNGTQGATVRLSYLKIRDVTTKDEEANGASTYIAVLPASEILKIGTEGNLRSYIPAHEGKKRNLVHKAIARTIRDSSDRFSQMNAGFLIGASKITLEDEKKSVTLRHASVNNGAQSQGEIRLYHDECKELGVEPTEFAIRCELSIEPDASTRTNIEDKYVDTRLLLQILWAMMPQELAPDHRRTMEARMRAYKNAAYCLQDFMEIYDHRADKATAARYQYFIDMAGTAWTEYERWKKLELWNDKHLLERLRQAVRGEDGTIKEVSDGIVFPILSALS